MKVVDSRKLSVLAAWRLAEPKILESCPHAQTTIWRMDAIQNFSRHVHLHLEGRCTLGFYIF